MCVSRRRRAPKFASRHACRRCLRYGATRGRAGENRTKPDPASVSGKKTPRAAVSGLALALRGSESAPGPPFDRCARALASRAVPMPRLIVLAASAAALAPRRAPVKPTQFFRGRFDGKQFRTEPLEAATFDEFSTDEGAAPGAAPQLFTADGAPLMTAPCCIKARRPRLIHAIAAQPRENTISRRSSASAAAAATPSIGWWRRTRGALWISGR